MEAYIQVLTRLAIVLTVVALFVGGMVTQKVIMNKKDKEKK